MIKSCKEPIAFRKSCHEPIRTNSSFFLTALKQMMFRRYYNAFKFLRKEADLKFGIRQFEAILMKDTLKCICFTFDYNDKFVTVWWLASSSCLRNHWRGICRALDLSRLGVWKVLQQSPMPSKFLLKETDLKFINCWLRALLALVSQLLIACRAKRLGRCPFFCRLFPRFATL